MSEDIVKSYGLENVEFEQVIDEKTGEQIIRMKPVVAKDGRVFELVTDPKTGSTKTTIIKFFSWKSDIFSLVAFFLRTNFANQRNGYTATI